MTPNTQTAGDGEGNASTTKKEDDAMEQPFSELRGLIERATPGPWYAAGGYVTRRHPEGAGFTASIFHLDEMGQAFQAAPFQAVPFARADDAKLICAAVNALPALLDERDRLIGEVAEAKSLAHEAFCIGVAHQDHAKAMRKALLVAHEFISNGVEYGFIRLPSSPDPALDTPRIVREALEAPPPAASEATARALSAEAEAQRLRDLLEKIGGLTIGGDIPCPRCNSQDPQP